MSLYLSYKINGTCPPFTVHLYSGATIVCTQLVSQTGYTYSMSNLEHCGCYNLCILNSESLSQSTCCFTSPSLPSVVSLSCTRSSGGNYCCSTGSISITPTGFITPAFTGETCLCLHTQIAGGGSACGKSCINLCCNGNLICSNIALSTGGTCNTSRNISFIAHCTDCFQYDMYGCVGAINSTAITSLSIIGTSPITLDTLNNEVNMCIGTPNCDYIVANNYVTVGKSVASCRVTQGLSPATVCYACGTLTIAPALCVSETMTLKVTGSTSTTGSGLSCIQFFCNHEGGGFVSVACYNESTPSPKFNLNFANGDVYCYNLWSSAPTYGASAKSSFKITGVTATGSYTPLICNTKYMDSISIACATTTTTSTTSAPTTTTTTLAPKTIAAVRTFNGSTLSSCCARGTLLITPDICVGQTMNAIVSGNTVITGTGTACVEFFCSTFGTIPYVSKCCVTNLTSSPHHIVLPYGCCDKYCYNICTHVSTFGDSAKSGFNITGVTGTGLFIPAICAANRSDSVSIVCATTTTTTTVP